MQESERPLAKKQILRMGQMFKFPTTADPMKELVDALMAAPDIETATKIITEVIVDATPETPCPMPSGLRSLITRALGPINPLDGCLNCNGIGYYVVRSAGGSEGMAKCLCWDRRPSPVYPAGKASRELRGQIRTVAEKLKDA